jgi:hypothetical protein
LMALHRGGFPVYVWQVEVAPRMKYEDWHSDLTVLMSFTSCSMYSPSVLLDELVRIYTQRL